MTDLTTLRTWLDQAETARHRLVTGSLVERMQHGDESLRYTPADMDKLNTYIAQLKSQIADCEGTPASRRRPINFTY